MRRVTGTIVMAILIDHSSGVVALIITTEETTSIINSFVRGSSLILHDTGLLEVLLNHCLADECSDASEYKTEY